MCTVEDVAASLMEIKRVLKPDGKLLFCEHGLAPEEKVVQCRTASINFGHTFQAAATSIKTFSIGGGRIQHS